VTLDPFHQRVCSVFLTSPKAITTFCSIPGAGSPVFSLSINSNSGPTKVPRDLRLFDAMQPLPFGPLGNEHHFADRGAACSLLYSEDK
jgi:hypothetical protein